VKYRSCLASASSGAIASFKIPQHVCFVEEFPLTVTGKIQKFVTRDLMKAQLGAREAITA